jgi:hypothetical protein
MLAKYVKANEDESSKVLTERRGSYIIVKASLFESIKVLTR